MRVEAPEAGSLAVNRYDPVVSTAKLHARGSLPAARVSSRTVTNCRSDFHS
jgi:hypothetical protein